MKEKKSGFYCNKCESIPLIEIIPKENDIKIFTSCYCHKRIVDYNLFMKNYYKNDLDFNNKYKNNEKSDSKKYNININLDKIIDSFNKAKKGVEIYNLEIKNRIIEIYQNKIKQIEKLYNQNLNNNNKLEQIIENLINNYKTNKENYSNILNLYHNTCFNLNFVQNTRNIHFKNYYSLDSLTKEIKNYLKSNFIIKQYKEQLDNVKNFYNHSNKITCFLEIEPGICASSSNDQFIAYYNVFLKDVIFKYKAHDGNINWINKISKDNLFSCGDDKLLKIWPKVKEEQLEIEKKIFTLTKDQKIIKLNPIFIFNSGEENILKTFPIEDNLICGFGSKKIHLYRYDMPDSQRIVNYEEQNNKNIEKIMDIIKITKKVSDEKTENFLVVHTDSKLILLNLFELEELSYIKIISKYPSINCLSQINNNEIIFSSMNHLNIVNIYNFRIKLKIKIEYNISCLMKLKDETIIMCDKIGIKRLSLKNIEHISTLAKIYNDTYINNIPPETFNYIYQLYNGNIVVCSSRGSIRICKFKLG